MEKRAISVREISDQKKNKNKNKAHIFAGSVERMSQLDNIWMVKLFYYG